MNDPVWFTDEETVLLADGEFFRKKHRISAKIRSMLEATHLALNGELASAKLLAPSGFDLSHHQFVKGEHLESCPYQYLDCPKYFHGPDKYTFRTLFWWGHHVVFSWILEGRLMRQYKKNLVDRFHAVAGRHLELSTAPTLWEWKCGEGYTVPLTHDRKATMAAVLAERGFLKIGRYVPLDDARVRQGDLAALAREAFAAMSPIISA